MRERTLGGLHVRLAGGTDREGGGDGPLVVLLHGFGAPGDDLVPLWRVLDVPEGTRFAFPAAPLELEMGYGESRAWWMIDPSLFADLERGIRRDRTADVPPALAEARARLCALLDDAESQLGAKQIVLGGFSQGAMLSLDVALHTDRPLAGLALLSGTLIARPEWEPRLPARRGLRVLQSHGRQDPLLPFSVAEQLRDLMVQNGLSVDFIPFHGAHQIPDKVLDRLGAFIGEVTG